MAAALASGCWVSVLGSPFPALFLPLSAATASLIPAVADHFHGAGLEFVNLDLTWTISCFLFSFFQDSLNLPTTISLAWRTSAGRPSGSAQSRASKSLVHYQVLLSVFLPSELSTSLLQVLLAPLDIRGDLGLSWLWRCGSCRDRAGAALSSAATFLEGHQVRGLPCATGHWVVLPLPATH